MVEHLIWAHPRSRGEHTRNIHRMIAPLGSSPLARGTRLDSHIAANRAGLIPARAGNTVKRDPNPRVLRAHPRSRGEHTVLSPGKIPRRGSSPLARGTPSGKSRSKRLLGLIPARAGNTPARSVKAMHGWAHPRSRGEHSRPLGEGDAWVGSSPLARGTLEANRHLRHQLGLIPARAGNTRNRIPQGQPHRAHPRSRGEHRALPPARCRHWGSSPLARGTHRPPQEHPRLRGLIPARAGNTGYMAAIELATGAHPRSRGEHRIEQR